MIALARRLAALGAALALGSLAAPWWGATTLPGNRSPLESPGPADAAIVLVVVAILALLGARSRASTLLPRPLGEGGLLIAAALWLAALIALRAIDGPGFGTAAGPTEPGIGIGVAAAGAGLVGLAGVQLRRAAKKG